VWALLQSSEKFITTFLTHYRDMEMARVLSYTDPVLLYCVVHCLQILICSCTHRIIVVELS